MRLNKRNLISLGIANDERGKDSCGIFIDGRYERFSTGEDKLFINAFAKSKLLKETKDCELAFVHCRKTSVGVTDEEHAQPVVIERDGEVLYVLMHNGTIYNYEELAKKYIPDINIKGMTDSQVMAHIFFYKGYNVLTEYEGAGTFVVKDYRNDALYMFRGASLDTRYENAKVKEERPLFVAQNGHSIIFSSIFPILKGLYYKHKIVALPCNKLWKVKDNKVLFVKEYDRSKCHQTKKYSFTYSTYNNDNDDNTHIESKPKVINTFKSNAVSLLPTTGRYIDAYKKLLYGKTTISDYGFITSGAPIGNYSTEAYFYDGILLRGIYAYYAVINYYRSTNDKQKTKVLAKLLGYNPYNLGSTWVYLDKDFNICSIDGEYQFPFTREIFVFEKGRCINKKKVPISNMDNPRPDELDNDKVMEIVDYVKSLQ